MRTSRIDNQPIGYISAKEACQQLKVKAATLYSYVSRGLIGCLHVGGRKKLYSQDDVARLVTRSAANKGHTAVAAAALRWGEPVLDSAITRVEDGELFYRGENVLKLLREERSFEEVAALLLGAPLGVLSGDAAMGARGAQLSRLINFASSCCVEGAELRHGEWISRFALLLGAELTGSRTLAEALCLGYQRPLSSARAIETLMICCADHELNVSTFTARVVASSGASTAACLLAALCAFSGKKHGGASVQIEERLSQLEACGTKEQGALIEEWLVSKESMPGFGHRLYQFEDPRATPLLEAAKEVKSDAPRYQLLVRWLRAAMKAGLVPTVDIGVVAVTEALRLPPRSAETLFALGRTVGWLAHIEEQRAQQILLRPRARYTGR